MAFLCREIVRQVVLLEEFDTEGIFLAEYLCLAAFDEYVEALAEDIWVDAM